MKRILAVAAVTALAGLGVPATAGARVRKLRLTYSNFLLQLLDGTALFTIITP